VQSPILQEAPGVSYTPITVRKLNVILIRRTVESRSGPISSFFGSYFLFGREADRTLLYCAAMRSLFWSFYWCLVGSGLDVVVGRRCRYRRLLLASSTKVATTDYHKLGIHSCRLLTLSVCTRHWKGQTNRISHVTSLMPEFAPLNSRTNTSDPALFRRHKIGFLQTSGG
jgi:hypothetical protein